MEGNEFEVVVVGSGPGGYFAAIRCAQLGLKTAIVEKADLGGVCLNWGCIPTKTLLKSAEVLSLSKKASVFGVNIGKVGFDLRTMVERSRKVASTLSNGISFLIKKNKITLFTGQGAFVDENQLDVKGVGVIKSKYFIIASGARPRVIPGFEPDGRLIWTHKDAMVPKVLPSSMVIIGSGPIGMEFASFYNALGVKVTVLENRAVILPTEDEEISVAAKKVFEGQGISFINNISLKSVDKSRNNLSVYFTVSGEDKLHILKSEVLLMAVGITANIENMGLEDIEMIISQGRIKVNGVNQTNIPNIYAIGDVASTTPWLAHKASHEGILAAESIAYGEGKYKAKPHEINYTNIPGCIYSNPQIASVGISEKAALAQGKKIKVGRFYPIGNGKSIALNESHGIIKVIFEESTGELLGAHMFGAEVTEMIQGFVMAKQNELTAEELMSTVFAHPTLSEMMHEAVLDAYGRAIHL